MKEIPRTPPEERRRELVESVAQKLRERGIELKDGHADLTALSNEAVSRILKEFVDSGFLVLHGTNTNDPYAELEPRQANDSIKESGNKNAVYATIEVEAALNHAIFNKHYVQSKLQSYTYGEENQDGNFVFKATPELYRMFQNHDPHLTADGYVYLLNRNDFISAPDAGGVEFQSEESQRPLAICKVSKKLGGALFVLGEGEQDTVRPYAPEEIENIDAHLGRMNE